MFETTMAATKQLPPLLHHHHGGGREAGFRIRILCNHPSSNPGDMLSILLECKWSHQYNRVLYECFPDLIHPAGGAIRFRVSNFENVRTDMGWNRLPTKKVTQCYSVRLAPRRWRDFFFGQAQSSNNTLQQLSTTINKLRKKRQRSIDDPGNGVQDEPSPPR